MIPLQSHIMSPFQNVANEPEEVFGGQAEVAGFAVKVVMYSREFSEQGDDSMKRVLWCLVAGAGLVLPVAAQAKDCCKPVKVKCCKPAKVKCCQPVAQTCCQQAAPTCCQAKAACCTSAVATPAPAAAAPAPAKKPYEEPAAAPAPAPAEKK